METHPTNILVGRVSISDVILQDLGVKFTRFYDVDVKKNMAGVLSALEKKIYEIVGTSPITSP